MLIKAIYHKTWTRFLPWVDYNNQWTGFILVCYGRLNKNLYN